MLQKAITIFLITLTLVLKSQDPYSFFIAGHTYGAPGVNNEGFHPPFKNKFGYIQNRDEIKFGVLTGDIVSENPIARDWDEIDAEIDLLGIPIHFAVGNHDMENRPLFEERYDSTYYSFTHDNDLFIVLDPNINNWNIEGKQLQFLKNVVTKNYTSKKNIFVFFHQVLWKKENHSFDYIEVNSFAGSTPSINFWPTVIPIFSNIPNHVFMFAGDIGATNRSSNVSYDIHNNITLIASGMGNENEDNFIVINVEPDKSVSYDLICLSDDESCLGELIDFLPIKRTDFALYPNPTTNYISLHINKNTSVQFFNTKGYMIKSLTFKNKRTELIDVSDLPRGIYAVKINNNKEQLIQKVILE